MRNFFGILFLLLLGADGCVTKHEQMMQAQQAYQAGQQAGTQSAAAQAIAAPSGPTIALRGPVQHPVLPWSDGLTLSQAIVDADYTGFMNPVLIRVIREGQVVDECKGIDLLHGHNVPLEAGDLIIIQ
jgi:hypothetical protein